MIKEANALYHIVIQKILNKGDLLYSESMNKYINNFEKLQRKDDYMIYRRFEGIYLNLIVLLILIFFLAVVKQLHIILA